jgi:hypothetical protein
MRTLVIDDLRVVRPEFGEVTYARTPNEGVRLLADERWDLVLLDHDLGMDIKTRTELDIWPCISYIEENAVDFGDTVFYIVTSNPWGALRMGAALDNADLRWFGIDNSAKARVFVA